MISKVSFAPPNSIVLISDPEFEFTDVPELLGNELISATDSCIAVGCRSEADGATQFTFGWSADVDPGSEPAFIGSVKTPSRHVALQTILWQSLLAQVVPFEYTRIRIWLDDPTEPDNIVVGLE
jgi:hypothetical protein